MAASVCIYTLRKTELTNMDVKNFNSQYPKLEVRHTKKFHERFLIIDGVRAYHIGASLRDAGQKRFAIDMLDDKSLMWDILKRMMSFPDIMGASEKSDTPIISHHPIHL